MKFKFSEKKIFFVLCLEFEFIYDVSVWLSKYQTFCINIIVGNIFEETNYNLFPYINLSDATFKYKRKQVR